MLATVLASSAMVAGATRASGQQGGRRPDPASSGFWWAAGALVAAAAASDARFERFSLEHRSPMLDDLESAGNVLGTGRYLIPAIGASYVLGRLTHRSHLTQDVKQRVYSHSLLGKCARRVHLTLVRRAILAKPLGHRIDLPDLEGEPL